MIVLKRKDQTEKIQTDTKPPQATPNKKEKTTSATPNKKKEKTISALRHMIPSKEKACPILHFAILSAKSFCVWGT